MKKKNVPTDIKLEGGKALKEKSASLSQLENLTLSYCERLTDAGLCEMMGICGPLLKSLDVSDTNITGVHLPNSNLKLMKVEKLRVSCCSRFLWPDQINLLSILGRTFKVSTFMEIQWRIKFFFPLPWGSESLLSDCWGKISGCEEGKGIPWLWR